MDKIFNQLRMNNFVFYFIKKYYLIVCCLLITFSFQSNAQCTSGCTTSFSTCANIVSIAAVNGTAGANNVVCISPPAGCGNITVGNVSLGQYQRLVVCTNSSTDTVKFVGNFAASGGGGAAANDNTRFLDIYGNAQFTYAGTIVWGSRLVINIASTGTLDLKNPTTISFLNAESMTNAGKIKSSSSLIFTSTNTSPTMTNSGSITATTLAFNGGSYNNTASGVIQSRSTMTIANGAGTFINNGNILAGCDLNITSGVFDNNNYVYSKCYTIVSAAISNNANFKTDGTLTLNASGTFNFQGGLFESDSLVLNGGNINAGTGCAAFIVHDNSNIQNGSGFTSVPANSVGIYDTGNPGGIDLISVGCGGTSPQTGPYTAGPYCGVIPLSGVGASGSGCFSTLPIEWLSYSARQLNDQQIKVEWSTANEIGNDYFTVQRSNDGIHFNTVSASIKSKGSSSLAFDYYFIDNFHYNGIMFYRIMQTDIDGKKSFSDIIVVNCSNSQPGLTFDVFPNPTSSPQDIQVSMEGLSDNTEVLIVLLDMMGNTLYRMATISEQSNMLLTFSTINNLQKGIYFITASNKQSIVTKKLIVE